MGFKSMHSGVRQAWPRYFTICTTINKFHIAFRPSFLICKMGMMLVVLASQCCQENKNGTMPAKHSAVPSTEEVPCNAPHCIVPRQGPGPRGTVGNVKKCRCYPRTMGSH